MIDDVFVPADSETNVDDEDLLCIVLQYCIVAIRMKPASKIKMQMRISNHHFNDAWIALYNQNMKVNI
jgi:hypothetical protein